MSQTVRHSFPNILTNQSQKEITHNEALSLIDALLHPAVESADQADPPPSPQDGELWIIAANATGDWMGQDMKIGQWLDGVWRFITPIDGMRVWLKDRSIESRYWGGAWLSGILEGDQLVLNGAPILSTQQAAIADPTGGSVIDVEARAAISAVLSVLRTHGLIAT